MRVGKSSRRRCNVNGISEIARESLKTALVGRTVYYTDRTGQDENTPKGHGVITDLILDENGKVHLQVKLTVGLRREAQFWAPLCEWTLVNGIVLDERKS